MLQIYLPLDGVYGSENDFSGLVQTSCCCRSKLARLHHDSSAFWFQTLNLTQLSKIAVAENKA